DHDLLVAAQLPGLVGLHDLGERTALVLAGVDPDCGLLAGAVRLLLGRGALRRRRVTGRHPSGRVDGLAADLDRPGDRGLLGLPVEADAGALVPGSTAGPQH